MICAGRRLCQAHDNQQRPFRVKSNSAPAIPPLTMPVSRNGGGSNADSELQPESGTIIAAAVENRAGEVSA